MYRAGDGVPVGDGMVVAAAVAVDSSSLQVTVCIPVIYIILISFNIFYFYIISLTILIGNYISFPMFSNRGHVSQTKPFHV